VSDDPARRERPPLRVRLHEPLEAPAFTDSMRVTSGTLAGRDLSLSLVFSVAYRVAKATPCAAFAMSPATAFGCDTYTA
jgi:hypothetical protein